MSNTTPIQMSRLEALGLIAFSGEDAATFLHGQLTCSVDRLPADRSTYGAYCTPKGRMLATVLLWHAPDGFLLQLPAALCEPVRKRLSIYILRSKVKARDASAEYETFGLAGATAAALIERLLGAVPQAPHGVVQTPHGMVLRLPEDRYEIVVAQAHAADLRAALAADTQVAPQSWWAALDIRAGIASVLPETQEQFIPQTANLDAIGAVSFDKGCYPGQEIVARMHYLGRLKERLYRAHIATADAPQPGDKVYGADLGAQASGMIANAAPAPGGYDVLAVVHTSSVDAGTLHWQTPDGPPLEILPLPYALPGR